MPSFPCWMGNSQETARKHYLKVRDGHFDRATESIGLHESLQQSAAAGRNDSQAEEGAHEKTLGKSKTQRLAASANTAEATVFVKTLGTGQATLSNSTCLK